MRTGPPSKGSGGKVKKGARAGFKGVPDLSLRSFRENSGPCLLTVKVTNSPQPWTGSPTLCPRHWEAGQMSPTPNTRKGQREPGARRSPSLAADNAEQMGGPN